MLWNSNGRYLQRHGVKHRPFWYQEFWSLAPPLLTKNHRVLGKMKSKTGFTPLSEFVGLRAKMYSLKCDTKSYTKVKSIQKRYVTHLTRMFPRGPQKQRQNHHRKISHIRVIQPHYKNRRNYLTVSLCHGWQALCTQMVYIPWPTVTRNLGSHCKQMRQEIPTTLFVGGGGIKIFKTLSFTPYWTYVTRFVLIANVLLWTCTIKCL